MKAYAYITFDISNAECVGLVDCVPSSPKNQAMIKDNLLGKGQGLAKVFSRVELTILLLLLCKDNFRTDK